MKFSDISLTIALALLLCCIAGVVSANETPVSDWFEKGNASIQQQKWGDAIEAFQNAVKEDPQNAEAWFKLGGSYLNNGNASEAYDAYLNATTIKPDYADAWANIGFVKLYDVVPPDAAGALEALKKATSAVEEDAGVKINYGIANLLTQNSAEAEAIFDELTQADPKNIRAWYWLGVTRSDSGKLQEGLDAYTKAVEINPVYKDAWFAKGDVEGFLGLQNESEKSFDTLLAIEGDYAEPFKSSETNDAEVYFRKGVIQLNLGNDAEAMTNFDKAVELNPNHHNAQYYRGFMLFLQNDLTGARTALEKAVELKDQFANAWYYLGRINLKEMSFPTAVENLQKATEIDSNLTDAWYYLGGILGDTDAVTEAIAAFDKVNELNPEYADAWYFKGLNQYRLEQRTEATDSFERALNLTSASFTPDLQANALYLIGLTQTEAGNTEGAAQSFNKSVALNETDDVAWNAYGTALNDLNKYEEALGAFEKAVSLNENDATAWYNKGNVERNLNETDTALTSYDKAISIDPLPRVWNSKGMALIQIGRNEDAVAAFDSGLKLDENMATLWYNKAGALVNLGRYDEAMEAVDKAIVLDPEYQAAIALKEQIASKGGITSNSTSGEALLNFTPDDAIIQDDGTNKTEENNSTIEFNTTPALAKSVFNN